MQKISPRLTLKVASANTHHTVELFKDFCFGQSVLLNGLHRLFLLHPEDLPDPLEVNHGIADLICLN